MIIKSTRTPAGRARQVAKYFSERGDNEEVSWLKGCAADILTMGEISKLAGKAFAVRHFSISPNERMNAEDLELALKEIFCEYQVPKTSITRMVVVQHKKSRASGENNELHWHLALPEVNAETLRTLSSSFYKMRNEKVSRICELRLGHSIVSGCFNKQVRERLEIERSALFLRWNDPCWEKQDSTQVAALLHS